MLAYVLALAVGLGSFALYMAAFFFPEVHRKNDFVWSGVGLFYALVLWVCAGRITGGLLLGQVAGVALLGWSITQTLQLRRQVTPVQQQTEVPSAEAITNTVQAQVEKTVPSLLVGASKAINGVTTKIGQIFNKSAQTKPSITTITPTSAPKPTVSPKVEVIDNRNAIPASKPSAPLSNEIEAKEVEVDQSTVPPNPTTASTATTSPLAEEEVIIQVIENTLTEPEQPVPSQPIHPHPPDPEIVEAALRDAEEKHLPASPPETEVPENPSPS